MMRQACWFLALLAGLIASGCQSEDEPSGPSAGSESHFLESCDATCSDGFECLCGVCTERCDDDATCRELNAAAECVDLSSRPAASACTAAGVTAFCDMPCTADAECASLGADFACSAGFCRESEPMTANGRIELSEVCDFYRTDLCIAGIGCYGWEYADVEHCLADLDCSGRAELDRLLAEGRVSYDPAAAYACHERLLADSCALGTLLFSPTLIEALSLCDAMHGQLAEGDACRNLDCGEGLRCSKVADECLGVCAPPEPPLPTNQPEGGACTPTICLDGQQPCGQCASGLICVDEVCRPEWDIGVPCSEANDCLLDYWCDRTLGECVRLAEVGEACRDFALDEEAPPCAENLWCNAAPFETGVCEVMNGSGGLCIQDPGCLDGLPCLPGGVDDPLGRGRCGAPLADGSTCSTDDNCVSEYCDVSVCKPFPAVGEACTRFCAEGLLCQGSVCRIERYLEESCTDAFALCIDSRCEGGTCVPMALLGEPCAADDDCALGHCPAGVCAEAALCE